MCLALACRVALQLPRKYSSPAATARMALGHALLSFLVRNHRAD